MDNIIAIHGITNVASLVMYETDGETATTAFSIIDVGYKYRRTTRIHYTNAGRAYITRRNARYYLDNFMRV